MYISYLQVLSFVALLSSSALALPSQVLADRRLETRQQGPGVSLTNKASKEVTFYFYNNLSNGDGTADPNFDKPEDPPTTVAPGATTFVPLPLTFKGRVQRGNTIPATWVEIQISASNDGHAHGDVSLEQGCDSAATITGNVGGTTLTGGFTQDVLSTAPAGIVQTKEDGTKAIASTVGNWLAGYNADAVSYLQEVVGQEKAYIIGGTGVPDIADETNHFDIVFY